MSDDARAATVQTLTAEVRTLVVGNRQVTMSVFKQLDTVSDDQIQPFGRVSPPERYPRLHVVGRHSKSGALVTANLPVTETGLVRRLCPVERSGRECRNGCSWGSKSSEHYESLKPEVERLTAVIREWAQLPLIVLAGLR